MKLAEYRLNDNLLEAIESQRQALGLTELATVVVGDVRDGDEEPYDGIYMAADQGIWFGKARAGADRLQLESRLTPWSDVYGASFVQAGFPYGRGEWLLTVHVGNPEIELHERMREGVIGAVQEFGQVCMKYQRGWAKS